MKRIPHIKFHNTDLYVFVPDDSTYSTELWECHCVTIEGELAPAILTRYDCGNYRIDVAKQGFWPKTLYFFIHELVHWIIYLFGNIEDLHNAHDDFFQWIHFGKKGSQ